MLIIGRREISEYVAGFERNPFRDCDAAATIMSPLALPLSYTIHPVRRNHYRTEAVV
jgi:hypothetical protein